MRLLIAALSAALLALPAAAADAGTSAAKVRSCNASVDFNLKISSARNMTCKAAKREQKSYKGSIGRKFDTPGGFHCKRVSGSAEGGQWRCHKGKRAYRFEFGD
jgi:hypothetical protein